MEYDFEKEIEFEDGTTKDVSFVAVFVNGGIGAYECHGFCGVDNHPELEEIKFNTQGLEKEEIEFINRQIENLEKSLEDAAWNAKDE